MKYLTLTVGDSTMRAELNETMAAKDLENRVPFTVSGQRSDVDYCCPFEEGHFDPNEKQRGWENYDINISDGWFAPLFAGAETSKDYPGEMMIVAHIVQEDQHLLDELPQSATFQVDIVEE